MAINNKPDVGFPVSISQSSVKFIQGFKTYAVFPVGLNFAVLHCLVGMNIGHTGQTLASSGHEIASQFTQPEPFPGFQKQP